MGGALALTGTPVSQTVTEAVYPPGLLVPLVIRVFLACLVSLASSPPTLLLA